MFELAQGVISSHLGESTLNLGVTAGHVGVSRWRLSRAFSQCQAHFRSYVRQARMLEAAHRLQQEVAIKEVALDLGYRYPSDFTRHFKKHWGVTPTAFREQARTPSWSARYDNDGRADLNAR